MTIAAFVFSVVAVLVSIASATYSRRQAKANEDLAEIERGRDEREAPDREQQLLLERQKDIDVAEITARKDAQQRAARDCESALSSLAADGLAPGYWGLIGNEMSDRVKACAALLRLDGPLLPTPLDELVLDTSGLLDRYNDDLQRAGQQDDAIAAASADLYDEPSASPRRQRYAESVGYWLEALAGGLNTWRVQGKVDLSMPPWPEVDPGAPSSPAG